MFEQANLWMEPVLKRELCRVQAPEDILNVRFSADNSSARAVRIPSRWTMACATAAVIVVAAVGLHGALRSAFAGQMRAEVPGIRAWVKQSTGLDLQGACHLCHTGESVVQTPALSEGAVRASHRVFAPQAETLLLCSSPLGVKTGILGTEGVGL